MKTSEIYEILKEAVNADGMRQTVIGAALNSEVYEPENKYDSNRVEGIRCILDELYINVLENVPEILPQLLPVFAIICGDREPGMIVANPDWDFIKKEFSKSLTVSRLLNENKAKIIICGQGMPNAEMFQAIKEMQNESLKLSELPRTQLERPITRIKETCISEPIQKSGQESRRERRTNERKNKK